MDAAGVRHALLVQPSCYGFDNTAMLHAPCTGAGRFRGIAVVAADTTEKELHGLADEPQNLVNAEILSSPVWRRKLAPYCERFGA